MFTYKFSNYLQMEINTELKIGRVLLGGDHIADITQSTAIVFHPEIFNSIEESDIKKSGLKFEFPEPSHILKSCGKYDIKELLMLIQIFNRSISE